MCGIVGLIQTNNSKHYYTRDELQQAAAAIKHRGPDGEGLWSNADNSVMLAHRRLSILDLSEHGAQPMTSCCGRYIMVFNGEIYNFQQLKSLLSTQGYSFKGHSDSEVLLNAVSAWGLTQALQQAQGMFAIAIWDREQATLFLARDRMGKKPLFYGELNNCLVFASELKAIFSLPNMQAAMDWQSVASFLNYSYVPTPKTIFKDLHKVIPGQIVKIVNKNQQYIISTETYWSPQTMCQTARQNILDLPAEQATDQLETVLSEAVAKRMIADVPVGAFLSGGIDSSVIVALMQAQATQPIKTFCIGYHDKQYNEAQHAKAVAEHLGTEHTELYLTPNDCLDVIPQLANIYDEPFADYSQIPTYLVSKLARQQVTVSLSGDGGDEMFGGYNRYMWAPKLWKMMSPWPYAMRRTACSLLNSISPKYWQTCIDSVQKIIPAKYHVRQGAHKIQKIAAMLSANQLEQVLDILFAGGRGGHNLVSNTDQAASSIFAIKPNQQFAEPISLMMYLDLVAYLVDDNLVKVDRASMANSLEVRNPLLDQSVVEFAWRLPNNYRIAGQKGKWLLRQVLYRHVPAAIIDRPKEGFTVPIDSWLRQELRPWAENLLSEQKLAESGMLDVNAIRGYWNEHVNNKANHQQVLWNILMLQAWRENWGKYIK